MLLLVCFILFNAVPDVVFFINNHSHSCYVIVSFFWSFGCLIDPIIYIFLNSRTRSTAQREIRSLVSSVSVTKSISSQYENSCSRSSIPSQYRLSRLSVPSQRRSSRLSVQYQHRSSRLSIQYQDRLSIADTRDIEAIIEVSEDISSVEIRSTQV